ncbi:hypothetical protein HNQ60_005196 [Povalibacter uvarum]|uniref:Uncharacterized protein n=1 Tax=Povalibacter uvarum TaxID=732238 RepID=A0A841HUF3_9GAMM|nr:hypothetical protein [Povalibacter uvarum]MBB6096274.1 hypothetical protein [Povalibacter uvarum]
MNTELMVLLPIAAQSIATLPADAAGKTGSYTTGSGGFLEVTRDPPLLTDPAFDFICETAEAMRPQSHCPYAPARNLTSRNFLPPSQIGQYLPHLRFHIHIDTIDHQPVAGGGIDNNADLNQFWLHWEFESNVAERVRPDVPAGFMFFNEPGELYDPPQPRTFWYGQVENGCSPAAHVDLEMHSRIGRDGGFDNGAVTLHDSFTGNGNYTIVYTIYAEEEEEAANFVFRGHLIAYCTDELWYP